MHTDVSFKGLIPVNFFYLLLSLQPITYFVNYVYYVLIESLLFIMMYIIYSLD